MSISNATKPLCATQTRISVGSATIAASARTRSSTDSVPMLESSSSTTAVTTTSPRSVLVAASAAAARQAARPPFMSYEPRP